MQNQRKIQVIIMKKVKKITLLLVGIILLTIILIGTIYSDKIDCDNNTIIISVCTGNMRALETGVSVYAGYNRIPLILTDKTMPEQLNRWLPEYIHDNNITKIIVVGPVSAEQMLNFMKLRVEVKQVNGDSISQILTKIAENDENISKDTIILTASDPLAGQLGAYTKTPVFVTASNRTYQSSENLDAEYIKYIENHDIKKAILVGNMPETIKTQLKEHNITIQELSGQNSIEVSSTVNNKLKNEGYLNNTTTAYYGFYGELPTIVPTLIKNNAIMIEDSSNTGNITQYLKNNSINTVYITRNTESDYIQMEETDYISTKVIENLEDNNISLKYLTRQRTLDEATGLYDMKILTAENMQNKTENTYPEQSNNINKTEPPLIAMLNKTKCKDSNNITTTITKESNDEITVKWYTIHPYKWKKIDDNRYYATTNTGYEYYWTKQNNTWTVQYKYNNTDYYNTTWTENQDNTWTEHQQHRNFQWKYDGKTWKCYDQNSNMIYFISTENV